MKVFETINKLKGTEATVTQIADWSYDNKVCPIMFSKSTLELDGKYPKELENIAQKCCNRFNVDCSYKCAETFLNTEIEKAIENTGK